MNRIVVALFSRPDDAGRAFASLRGDGPASGDARLFRPGPDSTGAIGSLGLADEEARCLTRGIAHGAAVLAVRSGNPDGVALRLRDFHPDEIFTNDTARDPAEAFKDASGPEHLAPENRTFSSSFDEFAGMYARDGVTLMGDRDEQDYAFAKDAYALGQRLAQDERHAGRDWTSAQLDARAEWDKGGRGAWDRAAPFVQNGWEEMRGMG